MSPEKLINSFEIKKDRLSDYLFNIYLFAPSSQYSYIHAYAYICIIYAK